MCCRSDHRDTWRAKTSEDFGEAARARAANGEGRESCSASRWTRRRTRRGELRLMPAICCSNSALSSAARASVAPLHLRVRTLSPSPKYDLEQFFRGVPVKKVRP